MATLFSNLSSGDNPAMLYTVTATETDRASTSVTFKVKVTATLESQQYSVFNADVYPKIKMGGVTKSFATLGTFPKGAGPKSSEISVTVTGISATTTSVAWTFSATTELGGTSSSSTGYVSGKSGTTSISKYATTPSMSGAITIKDGSTVRTTHYREAMGADKFTLSWPGQSGGNGTITYEIERSYDGELWTDIGTSSSASFTHDASDSETTIRYRVRAKNTVGSDNLYSGWIYSATLTKNVMTAPTITSSATVSYNTGSFSVTIKAASDSLKSAMTYTLAGTGGTTTTLSGSATIAAGNLTITTRTDNTAVSGFHITFDNQKKAALNGATHSDTSPYKGTLNFTLTAKNAYGTTKTDTLSVAIDLGKDAPISATPAVSIESTSYVPISSVNYLFPEHKAMSFKIPANIKDALGRNCSFDMVMKEGTVTKTLKNTGVVTATTGVVVSVSATEAALATAKKTVSFYVAARTYNQVTKNSTATANVDLHYYKKPIVTYSGMIRGAGTASFKVSVTQRNSLGTSVNTITGPASSTTAPIATWAKGTSTVTGIAESLTISATNLDDTYTKKVIVVVRDSIGMLLLGVSNDSTMEVTIPKFTPMLSVREKGVGVNTHATEYEALRVGGNITIDMKPTTGGQVQGDQGKLIWATDNGKSGDPTSDDDRNQAIQLRYNSFDNLKAPFGLHLEKTPTNTDAVNHPYLSVDGEVEGKVKVQSPEYWLKDPVNKNVKKAMYSHGSSGSGVGIVLGAGGETIIGGGEGAVTFAGDASTDATSERIVLVSDNAIELHTDYQNGAAGGTANKFEITKEGYLGSTMNKYKNGYNFGAIKVAGANHYDTMVIQSQVIKVTIDGATSGWVNFNYPDAFDSVAEWVLATPIESNSFETAASIYYISATGARVYLRTVDEAKPTRTYSVNIVSCGRMK